MRKLASIKKIDNLEPIDGADKIELATVGGWKVVVAKNVGHRIGDKVVYCEIDSFLPIEPEFEFLRKSSYKKMADGTEGFRLRTIKLRKQISQGLILPLEDAINVMKRRCGEVYHEMLQEGVDVTQMLGITKWEPPLPANLQGNVKRYFPSFIKKTDEVRIQNLKPEYQDWKNNDMGFYVTEKLDGSSATYYYKDGEFGVCSRNLELKKDSKNTFWRVADELKIEEKLKEFGRNIAIQGELIGEGIQKNRYGIKGQTVKFFNVFDIDNSKRLSYDDFCKTIIEDLNLQTVPITAVPGFKLPQTIDELLKMADKKSSLNDKTDREGIVVRSRDNQTSFKVISNKFLLKN
jgi:RNA ligase (TIGR02306 family)